MSRAIILFAHGARDPEWASPIRRVEASIRRFSPEVLVDIAFLEFMSPDLRQCTGRLVDSGARRITIVPMFIAQGGHLKREVPGLVEGLRSTWPNVEFSLARAIGEEEEVVLAMATATLRQLDPLA